MKKIFLLFILLLPAYAQDDSWMLYDDSQVAIINITTSPEAIEYMYTEENFESDSMHMATVHFKNAFIDETIDSVGLRLRGNTSRFSIKKSFKLDFEHYIPGREFYDVDKLNLNGEHNDPSIIRSKLAWDFFKDIGIISSKAAHAAVYINGDYYGLYISVEHYDREFLKKNFDDPNGNLWKCLYNGSPADLQVRGEGLGQDYDPAITGEISYKLTTNEELNDFSKLAQLIDIINNTSDSQFPVEIEKNLDMKNFIKVMAMDVILGSWDDYWSLSNNYYLYHQPDIDMFYFIPYDYDNIMSIDWFEKDWATEDIYNWFKINNGGRPLVERMLDNDHYYNLYTHFVEFYNENLFALNLWEDRMDSIYTMIRPYVIPDSFSVWQYDFRIDDFDNSFGSSYENQHVKKGIRQYVTDRNTSIPQQVAYRETTPVIYELSYSPERPVAGDTITFNVSVFDNDGLASVDLNYLLNGANLNVEPFKYNPQSNTKKVEEYDNWTAKILAPQEGSRLDCKIFVEDNNGYSLYYPQLDTITIIIPGAGNDAIIVNEFLAQNNSVNQDENSQYEDWIEIYNPTDAAIDLADYHLTDRSDNLAKWQFPDSGSIIEAGGFLLIWCDEDQQQGVLHTNFKLAAGGEFIALSGPDGVTVIDSLSYTAQSPDISFGRDPDGSDNWSLFSAPTPGSSNTITAIEEQAVSPQNFKLQAYPNPFNNTVKISYNLKQSSTVSVRIYNMLGKIIWQRKTEKMQAGTHSFNWDGRTNQSKEVSSGLYVVAVNSASLTEKIKVILLK